MRITPGGRTEDLGRVAPVEAVDRSAEGVAVAAANARRNHVDVRVRELDLLAEGPPNCTVLAANVPAAVHEAVAAKLPDAARRS